MSVIMNKNKLIESIAVKSDIPSTQAHKALDALIKSVTEELSQGGNVQLVGFGTFSVSERGERKGFNPRTKEQIIIKSHNAPVFKPGKKLKTTTNN